MAASAQVSLTPVSLPAMLPVHTHLQCPLSLGAVGLVSIFTDSVFHLFLILKKNLKNIPPKGVLIGPLGEVVTDKNR